MVSSSTPLVESLRHTHDHGVGVSAHETRTRWVVVLTCGMMVGELIVGYLTTRSR
jgi:Co/Zn/Cd efflux system component